MSPKYLLFVPLLALAIFGCEPREQRQQKSAVMVEAEDTGAPVVLDVSKKAQVRAAYLEACHLAEEKAEKTNEANLKRWNEEVERLRTLHTAEKENYETAKKHHAEAMAEYSAAVGEREATQRLNLARLLLDDGKQSIAETRLYKIISDFPRTQSAKDAKALLAGKQVAKRTPPEAASPPVAPSAPALSLPPRPKEVQPDYPPDPDEEGAGVNVVSTNPPASGNVGANSASKNVPGYKSSASGDYRIPHTMSSGKTVYVREHTTKNGTHVPAHMRSAPGSGSSRRR